MKKKTTVLSCPVDLLDENEQEQEDDLEMLRSIFETEIEQYFKTYKRGK